jgi:uncharacterized protein YegP (UPF0339 family)
VPVTVVGWQSVYGRHVGGTAARPRRVADAPARFAELSADAGSQWRWRLRHRKGNVIADGGQGYAERTGAHDAIESGKADAPGADVTEQ